MFILEIEIGFLRFLAYLGEIHSLTKNQSFLLNIFVDKELGT